MAYRQSAALIALALIAASASMLAQRPARPFDVAQGRPPALPAEQAAKPSAVPARPAAKPTAFPALERQAALDRAGFSPGELDGNEGSNTTKALAAYGRALEPGAVDTLVPYTITADDVAGPFGRIPADMMAKAKLKSLGFATLTEALAERFHSSPRLLTGLNPGKRFAAGTTIMVPNVRAVERPPAGAAAATSIVAAKVVVSRGQSSATVFDATGKILFYAPVTSGSEHDPLPIGEWTVTSVLWNPKFNYNPDLFWDADPAHTKTMIPAGPNGPVGVVWIDINKPHYGLHGSPEPSKIGHTASHGCVRLTNWDATTLGAMVRKGTPVVFVE